MPSSTSSVLIGSALLVAAAAAATAFYSSSDSKNNIDIADIDDDDQASDDFITAEEVTKIFDRLFLEMQGVLAQLSQTVQQIQMSGQHIPEQQLRQLLKQEFQRALTAKQKQILDEFEMDEDCLEEATWEFLEMEEEHPKVKKAVERFQKLWENVSGESVVGRRPGSSESKEAEPVEILSAEKTVEVAEVYFAALTNTMSELVQGFKKEGKNLRDPAVAEQLHIQFSSVVNDKGEEALQALGVSLSQFQKSIEANSSNPTVGRSLAMMQMQQQQALMSMGVGG